MAFEVIPFKNATELAHGAAGRWLDQLAARKDLNVSYCVALSGGRVARDFFAEAARQIVSRSISMAGVHFFWSDERCVPPTNPDSNFAEAQQLLLAPLQIPAAQIHRLRGEADEPVALREAVEDILRVTGASPDQQPVLNLVFLGVGEEGHVASLFPGEPAEVMASPAVFRATTVTKPPPRRITMGYGTIAAAREVWVLASGQGKEQALRESLSPQGKTPLARVLRLREMTRIFTDVELGR